jgi:hypothetical protein
VTTIVLQLVVALLRLAFGILALLIARKVPNGSVAERAAWFVTGVVFTLQGISVAAQASFGAFAFIAGPGSTVYAEYLRWAPAANHSRGLLTYALYGSLFIVLLRGAAAIRWKTAFLSGVAVVALFGGAIGFAEGTLIPARHLSNIALSEALTFVVAAALLFAALFRPLLDRWLWGALAVYGFSGIINSLYIAAMAWADVPEAWIPSALHLQAARVLLAAIIVGMAAWRLRLAMRGERPGAFVEQRQTVPVFDRL